MKEWKTLIMKYNIQNQIKQEQCNVVDDKQSDIRPDEAPLDLINFSNISNSKDKYFNKYEKKEQPSSSAIVKNTNIIIKKLPTLI